MKNKISLILATLVILLGSCASQKKVPYMIDAETIPQEALDKIAANNEPRVMPGDLLEITVMSYNIDAVRPFNRSSFVTELNRTTSNYSNDTNRNTYYIVDDNGDIEFPVIGKLRIADANRRRRILASLHRRRPSADAIRLYVGSRRCRLGHWQ